MYKWNFIFFTILFVFQNSNAQKNNIWYFGHRAGLSFNITANQSIPSPLLNSAMDADEGCASVSDDNGQILFYTNGVTVYNRLNKVMLNGDNLDGNVSACQSGIIVPVPGNDSIYYIFTTGAVEDNFSKGYKYSIVNMKRDNGNGEIIVKNSILWPSATERICAVRHGNGSDVWLITNDHDSNIFRAWLISCNGLQPIPVVSTVGIIMNQHHLTNTGYIKASPDGKQLCQTHFPPFDEINYIPNFCQLFDFDNVSGVLSNARSIGFPDAQISSCEYSPDSKLLYLVRPNDKAIDQFECTLGSSTAIAASRVTISTGSLSYFGIQAAPDGKIYLSAAFSKYLGAINRPNVKGLGCNYNEKQADLINFSSFLGLPAFINDLSYDPLNGFTHSIVDSCPGTVQFNGFSSMSGTLQWQWDFGDGGTSNIQNPMHTFNPPNKVYPVKLKVTSSTGCGGVILKSKNIKPQGIISKIDFDFSSDCNSHDVIFNNTTPFLEDSAGLFIWDFGDGSISNEINPVHTYNIQNSYKVKLKLKTSTTCLDDSVSHDVNLLPFKITASPDQTILIGQKVKLNASSGGKNYQWEPATWLNNPISKNPIAQPLDDILYIVSATDKEGCESKDSVFIKVLQFGDVFVPSGFTPNNDGKNDRIKPLYGKDIKLEEFRILNRWGQTVYITNARDEGWDGKINNTLQNPDVFVWIIKAISPSGIRFEKRGTFVLMR